MKIKSNDTPLLGKVDKVQNPFIKDAIYDVVGIGAGPFNLAVAALLSPINNINAAFLEARPKIQWHPGMLLRGSTIQNNMTKDIVSLADPTSRFSFPAFLHAKKRIYEYLNAGFARTTRVEFEQYLRWVADQLPFLHFDSAVQTVEIEKDILRVTSTNGTSLLAKNIVVGTGPRPRIPAIAMPLIGNGVFHVTDYLTHASKLAGKSVAVIGGGQSGAEVFLNLLTADRGPTSITWITRRPHFSPIDESHFTNELFTPAYVEHFHKLSSYERQRLLTEQKLSSDGISLETIEAIYQALYEARHLRSEAPSATLMNGRELVEITSNNGIKQLVLQKTSDRCIEHINAGVVILATGFEQQKIPHVLNEIREMIEVGPDGPMIRSDFSVVLRPKLNARIFVLNSSLHAHGISEPNLSLAAWRAATIVNSIIGITRYELPQTTSFTHFDPLINKEDERMLYEY